MNRILKPLVVLLLCSGSAVYAQDVAEPLAPGWVAYHRPTEDERRCANYSKQAWTVTLNSDKSGVVISKYDGTGYSLVMKVRDGRLVGEDNGEWGGGLWWVPKNGRRQRLLRENVFGLVKTSTGVLVITGLRHMGANEGDVWRYIDVPGQKKRAEHLVDLGWAPFAFTQDSPDSLLVLTSDGFMRVHPDGRLETLYRRVYGILYPDSIAISPNGVIHVGMRHFITRLTPAAGTYKEEWFVPANCTTFRTEDYDCVCGATPSKD
jgi:hypothetical protein